MSSVAFQFLSHDCSLLITLPGEPAAMASAKRPVWPRAMRLRPKAKQPAVTDRAKYLEAGPRARRARVQSRAERRQNPQQDRSKASEHFP